MLCRYRLRWQITEIVRQMQRHSRIEKVDTHKCSCYTSAQRDTFDRQLDLRHLWQLKGDRCNRALKGGCSALLLLNIKKDR